MARDKRLIEFARRLRRDQTSAETRLWEILRSEKLEGFRFRRQHPLPPYIADFCCVKAAVVVELDGNSHLGNEIRDESRTLRLQQMGFEVVRFWNSDVFLEENRVIETIVHVCKTRLERLRTQDSRG